MLLIRAELKAANIVDGFGMKPLVAEKRPVKLALVCFLDILLLSFIKTEGNKMIEVLQFLSLSLSLYSDKPES